MDKKNEVLSILVEALDLPQQLDSIEFTDTVKNLEIELGNRGFTYNIRQGMLPCVSINITNTLQKTTPNFKSLMQGFFTSKWMKERSLARRWTEQQLAERVVEKSAYCFLEERQSYYQDHGLYLAIYGATIMAFPCRNQFVVLAVCCPFIDIEEFYENEEARLEWFLNLYQEYTFKLIGIGSGTLIFKFINPIKEPKVLLEKLMSLKPDEIGLVKDGIVWCNEKMEMLAEELPFAGAIIRLWWD